MSYVSTCLADGAVGLWELGESSTASAAADQAGNSNGTYQNTANLTAGQTGIPGGAGATAMSQTSTTGDVSVPSVAANVTIDTFTFECWIKMSSLPGAAVGIMGVQAAATAGLLMNTTGSIALVKMATSTLVTSTSNFPADSKWHHIVVTKNGSTVHQYLDGVDVTGAVTNATMLTSSGHGYWLMKNNTQGSLVGTHAMYAVYPTALSSGTVSNHYSLGLSPVNSVAPVVSGTTTVGSVLSTTNGTWVDNGGSAFTYQWQDSADGSTGWANISSATSSTYTVGAGESGKFIRCVVTDTSSSLATAANSNVLGAITGGSISTIVGKTGTSGTAAMQKSANGYTYITGKTGTSGTAVDQKGAGSFTKVSGH